jgi:cytochrome c-type biogenesis protein CcmH/NrfG
VDLEEQEVAEMNTRLYVLTLVLCAGAPLAAQESSRQAVPDRAIAAESAGQWQDAIVVYRDALRADPQRVDLWLRLADVHAQTRDLPACIDALEHASRLAPSNASIHARLSQTYATAGQVEPARRAIERALALQPESREYLIAQAQLSTWAGQYAQAAASYRRVLALNAASIASGASVSGCNFATCSPVAAAHRRMVPSSDSVSTRLPSGLYCMSHTTPL